MWKRISVHVVLLLIAPICFLKAQVWQRDPSFSTTAKLNNVVYSSILRGDGKLILAGSFNQYGTTTTNKVLRLESDGQLDTSFSIGNGPNSHIYASCLQPDGCLLIAGQFTMIDTASASHIARLNPDGSIDTSFHVGVGPNSNILSMAYQPDGKILIAGTFTQVNGVSRNRIARLMHDGSLDTSFHVGSGANQSLWKVVLQPNGKILIGGGLSSYNGVSRNRIARLNSDGSLDASFDPGSGAMSIIPSNAKVSGITIQPDGCLLVCGKFQTFNEVNRNNIVRLYPDGSIDQTFLTTLGANDWIWDCALDSSNRIILVGYFTTYDGDSSKFIARLFSNGIRDTLFSQQIKLNNMPRTVVVQPDGKVFLGGHFTKVNQDSISFLTRLSATIPLPWFGISLRVNTQGDDAFLEWKASSTNKEFIVQHCLDGESFETILPNDIQFDAKKDYSYSCFHQKIGIGYHCYRVIDKENEQDQSSVVCVGLRVDDSTIFPNPATDKVRVQISCTMKRPMLQILNSSGTTVWLQKDIEKDLLEIDISSWPKGTYVARLITPQQRRDMLFTKEKD